MKFVYLFREGDADLKNLLGGKGGNLCEMTKLKLPVPEGFVVSTEACLDYYEKGELSEDVKKQILSALQKVEEQTGRTFGDGQNPLLLSIRSGARVSMPGMMDTILDLGLTDKTVKTFAKTTTPFFAYDCYRRFIQMYGNVVMGIDDKYFEKEISKLKKKYKVNTDQEFLPEHLMELIDAYKTLYKQHTNKAFPQDIYQQLLNCVESVFKSWNNERAKTYRKINNIPDEWGTAVNVQMMVFGNLNENSGTGVC
ncbi:MAG: pyruvate, phosphate dikinase, partial [Clostridia bacterium]|nr:pyruvate, phosphate dikinase [Clostridia bacterium]